MGVQGAGASSKGRDLERRTLKGDLEAVKENRYQLQGCRKIRQHTFPYPLPYFAAAFFTYIIFQNFQKLLLDFRLVFHYDVVDIKVASEDLLRAAREKPPKGKRFGPDSDKQREKGRKDGKNVRKKKQSTAGKGGKEA